MAVAWPAFLQDFLNTESFSYTIGDTTISSDVDVGPAKKRRRFTKSVDKLTCTINLPFADFQQFYDFFDVTLNGGIEYFTFDHPFTGVATDFRMGPPKIDPMGGVWFKVTMEWEKKL